MATVTLLSGSSQRSATRRVRLSRRAVLALLPAAGAAATTALLVERRQAPSAAVTAAPLLVTSVPSGATVLVDGRPQGHTPARLALAPGSHALLLQRPGCLPSAVPVQTSTGSVDHLAVTLWRCQPAVQPLRPPFPGSSISSAGFLADGRLALTITLPPGNVHQLWRRDQTGRLAPLGSVPTSGPFAIAPDGGTISSLAPPAGEAAPSGGEPGLTSVWTSRAEGGSAHRRYALPPDGAGGRLDALAWAPAGRHLLLVRSDASAGATRSQLLWLDLASGTARRLLELPAAIVPGSFLWSPAGDRVAFLTQAGALLSLCLLWIAPPTFRYLTDLSAADESPLPYPPLTWSPDGRQVVYAAPVPVAGHSLGDLLFGSHSASALFHTDVADPQSRRLGNAFGSMPVWRPDGSILAFLPASRSSGLQWETVDPTSGRAQAAGPVILPAGGAGAVSWDLPHQQALHLQQDSGGRAFALLSFAPAGR